MNITWDNRYTNAVRGPKSISDIVGKTPVGIEQTADEIVFAFSDGTACKFYHYQDCCETVGIDDVNGSWDDLLNTPLLVAEERDGESGDTEWGTYTWTFYAFRSIAGSVDVKWVGESNGYYSESVDFCGGIIDMVATK